MDKYLVNKKEKKIFNGKIPRYDSSFIVATLSKNQSIAAGANSIVFDSFELMGTYFKKNGSKIEVLKDCCAYVSGNVFVDGTAGEGYVWSHIYVNSTEITNHLERIVTRDYTQTSIPAKPIDLKKGDLINMTVDYTSSSGVISLRNSKASTFLSVVKI